MAIGEAAIALGDDPSYSSSGLDDSDWSRGHWSDVGERGVWWLRRSITVPTRLREADAPIGLYIQAAASAEVWWNGQRIGGSGEVGASPDSERPGPVDVVISLPPEARQPGEHLLAIRFSSQHLGAGIATPVDGLFLAAYGPPTRFLQDRYRPSIVLGGSLALAFIFLVVLWFRERQPDTGWLLLACGAALAQLLLEVSRAFIRYPYPWHEVRLDGIAAMAALGGAGLVGHFAARFQLPRLFLWVATVAATAAALLLFEPRVGTATIGIIAAWLLVGITACALAVRRRRPGALPALAALTLMMAWLWIEPMSFTDRYYFLALVALLLLAFADTVRRHAHAREARERAEHRSDRLALELLKRQLRPHFLLNTLTTLQEWLETEPRTAARMIDALAREFRMLDRMAQHQLVALDDELALCRAHLEVMSHRREREFGLCVRGDTDLMIPPATLHTLLENAITHSRHGEEETVFELDVQRDSERSVLTLTTPLENEGRAQDATEGTGLAYIRARLREAFGSDAEVRSASGEDRWTTRIRMPTRPRSTAHDGAQPILE